MLKNLTKCFVFTSLIQTAIAQPGVSFRALEEASLSVDSMKVALSLTTEQVSIVNAINDRYSPRFDSMRMSNDNRFEKFAKTRRLKEERDNELKLLLSEKQFRTYRAEQESQRDVNPGIPEAHLLGN